MKKYEKEHFSFPFLCTSNAFASLYVLIRFVFVVDGTVTLTDISGISHKLAVRKFCYLHLTISLHDILQYSADVL